jgi:hypothetical protein
MARQDLEQCNLRHIPRVAGHWDGQKKAVQGTHDTSLFLQVFCSSLGSLIFFLKKKGTKKRERS